MHTHWLVEQKGKHPDDVAMIFNQKSYTFEEVYDAAHDIAERLKGLEKNRIALYIHNHRDAYFLINACMLAGIEIVLLNNRLTETEIKAQLDDVDVDTVIATRDVEWRSLHVLKYENLESFERVPFEVGMYQDDDILSVMFTSGTTGRAKAVAQTYGNHFASEQRCRLGFGYTEESVWLLVNPIFHISGLSIVFRGLISGCTVVINEKFDVNAVIDLMNVHQVTHTSFVPVMLERLIDEAFDWGRFEGVLLGGAGVQIPLLKRALSLGIPVFNSYGMTETMSQMIMIGHDDEKLIEGAVGKVAGREIVVRDGGHVLVDLPVVSPGYLNAAMDKYDGYFETGDLGRIDSDGYLYILDRRVDLIISGGENIYPSEIEKIVHSEFPSIDCVVVKKSDDLWGEVPVLLLATDKDERIIERLNASFEAGLARFKHPKEIRFVPYIERTQTGKISRVLNKEKYVDY